MVPSSGGRQARARVVLLFVLLVALFVGEVWFFNTAAADPYGLTAARPITPANLGAVDPLYGRAWTPGRNVAWSTDGRYIALGDFERLTILDSPTGRVVADWAVPGDVMAVAWSPDGQTVAVAVDTTESFREGWVFLYDPRGVPQASWRVTDSYVVGIAWSSDGSRFLTSSSDQYWMWSPSGTEIYHHTNVTTHGATASWSPDGRKIALGGLGSPVIIDAASGDPLWVSSSGADCEVAWSPRGDAIAAGCSDGSVGLFAPSGSVLSQTHVAGAGWIFGVPVSWNADGTLLAVPTLTGLVILAAEGLSVERTLAFPMSDFLPSAPNGITYDWNVAWSPKGSAIAATGTTSHPSFRLWGIRHTSLGAPMIGLGLVGGVGLALLFRQDLLWVVMSPDRVGLLWNRTDPRLRMGRALFFFALASSILYSYETYALARVYGLQALPSLVWFFVSSLLAIPVVVLAGFVASEVFHASVWPASFPRPFSHRAAPVFGYVLFPSLLAAGFAQILFGLWLTAVPSLNRVGFSFGFYAIFGTVLGIGFYLSGRLVRGFPWARVRLPWIALLLSAGASVLLLLASVFFLVVALNVLRVAPPGGEFSDYGFTILLGFGFVPFAVAIVGLGIVAASAGVPAVLRILGSGYARVQGGAVLELETRRKVLELVASKPGAHFRELLTTSGLGSGTLHYHLSVLEREGFVTWHRQGRKKQFFSALGGDHRPIAEILRGI